MIKVGEDTLPLHADKGEGVPVLQLGREGPGTELELAPHCPGEWAASGAEVVALTKDHLIITAMKWRSKVCRKWRLGGGGNPRAFKFEHFFTHSPYYYIFLLGCIANFPVPCLFFQ